MLHDFTDVLSRIHGILALLHLLKHLTRDSSIGRYLLHSQNMRLDPCPLL